MLNLELIWKNFIASKSLEELQDSNFDYECFKQGYKLGLGYALTKFNINENLRDAILNDINNINDTKP